MDFSVRFSTTETAEYREGEVRYEFFIGTFVDVPRAEDWDRVVPDAFRGRREEIAGRLKGSATFRNTPFRDVFV